MDTGFKFQQWNEICSKFLDQYLPIHNQHKSTLYVKVVVDCPKCSNIIVLKNCRVDFRILQDGTMHFANDNNCNNMHGTALETPKINPTVL